MLLEDLHRGRFSARIGDVYLETNGVFEMRWGSNGRMSWEFETLNEEERSADIILRSISIFE